MGLNSNAIKHGITRLTAENCSWLCPFTQCPTGILAGGINYDSMAAHCWRHSFFEHDWKLLKHRMIVKRKGVACGLKQCRKEEKGWTSANAMWRHMKECKTKVCILRRQKGFPSWYNKAKANRLLKKKPENMTDEVWIKQNSAANWSKKQRKENQLRMEVQQMQIDAPFKDCEPFSEDEPDSQSAEKDKAENTNNKEEEDI